MEEREISPVYPHSVKDLEAYILRLNRSVGPVFTPPHPWPELPDGEAILVPSLPFDFDLGCDLRD